MANGGNVLIKGPAVTLQDLLSKCLIYDRILDMLDINTKFRLRVVNQGMRYAIEDWMGRKQKKLIYAHPYSPFDCIAWRRIDHHDQSGVQWKTQVERLIEKRCHKHCVFWD